MPRIELADTSFGQFWSKNDNLQSQTRKSSFGGLKTWGTSHSRSIVLELYQSDTRRGRHPSGKQQWQVQSIQRPVKQKTLMQEGTSFGPPEMEEIDVVSIAQKSQVVLPVINRPCERHGVPSLGIPCQRRQRISHLAESLRSFWPAPLGIVEPIVKRR